MKGTILCHKSGVSKTKSPKTLRLVNEESNLKPSIWLTLGLHVTIGLKLGFRPRVSQIEGFMLLSSFLTLRVLGVFKTLHKSSVFLGGSDLEVS